MKTVTFLVVGGGSRGTVYASMAASFSPRARVVGVAEPRADHRTRLMQTHAIPPENAFTDWSEAAARPRFADAVIIATHDALHADPAVAFAKRGYHVLLEKPMAPNEADCRRIVKAAQEAGVLVGVCHVLRYTSYTRKLKQLLDAGVIGEVESIQHLEPVGYWHHAHSFVRGNWRNSAQSSSMLLAKSSHDLDWIRHVMGVRCTRVSSFGSLRHFRTAQRPAGAADRCLDCPEEKGCPYSAPRIYLGRVRRGQKAWPVDVLTLEPSETTVLQALRDGPYGRCVYACDNDVVDNQVVSMEFEGGRTASFTMTAFTPMEGRRTHVCGTRGHVYGDSRILRHFDFLTEKTEEIDTAPADPSALVGHGGGDRGLMDAFIDAVATGDASRILSGAEESLETHLMVFAAERARLRGTVEEVR